MRQWQLIALGVVGVVTLEVAGGVWVLTHPVRVSLSGQSVAVSIAAVEREHPWLGKKIARTVSEQMTPMLDAQIQPLLEHAVFTLDGVPLSLNLASRTRLTQHFSAVMRKRLTATLERTPVQSIMPASLGVLWWQRFTDIPIPIQIGPISLRVVMVVPATS